MKKALLCGVLLSCLIGCNRVPSTQKVTRAPLAESTPIITSLDSGWSHYRNEGYGFEFSYPSSLNVEDISFSPYERQIRIRLQKAQENQYGKRFEVFFEEQSATDTAESDLCQFSTAATDMRKETINGILFQASNESGGMGWERASSDYCTVRNGKVFTLSTIIEHPENIKPDLKKESYILQRILLSFKFIQ